jgi:predicted nucleic acid-binding protein
MPYAMSVGNSSSVVIDANVWVSALLPHELRHAVSSDWIARNTTRGSVAACPVIVLPEVAGALSRQLGNSQIAAEAIRDMRVLSGLNLVPIDEALALEAAEIARDLRLRGADAVYVALAARLSLPLVTWDQDMLDRAAGHIEVRTPGPGDRLGDPDGSSSAGCDPS